LKLGSFAAAAAVITLVFALLAFAQSEGDLRAHADTSALLVARAVAWTYAEEQAGDPDGRTQRLLEALPGELPAVKSALVLKGNKIVAHSAPDQAGRSLSQDSLSDKALYDSAQAVKASASKNVEERERDPSLKQDPYPEVEIASLPGGAVAASAPVRNDEDRVVGLARVEMAEPLPTLPYPALIVLIGLIAMAIFLFFARRSIAVPAGVVLLLFIAVADVWALSGFRFGLRRSVTLATAQNLGALARAGVLPPDVSRRPALIGALGRDAHGRMYPIELVDVRPVDRAMTRSATLALGAIPGGERFEAGDHEAWFVESSFEAAYDRDFSDLSRWAFLSGMVAIGLFVMGARGRIHAFWSAFTSNRTAYGYLAPAMVGMGILVFVPVVFGIVLGFTDRRYNVFEFAGLSNYVAILSDFDFTSTKNFYFKLGVTFLWTGANVMLHVGIGLFIALLLNDEMLRAKGIYRVLLVVPWAIPNYITALIWKGMFHKQFGAVNFFLDAVGLEPVAWFGSFWPAFMTNVATNTWLGFPFMMVVSLGALSSIPNDLYEAAFVDGASRWQRFKDITLPLLMPALVPAVIMGTVWTFNMFNIIYLVSGGAPDGATDILITDAFRWAFERDKYGYAAAYSTIIFLILLFFTLLTNKVTGATKGAFE